MNTRFKIILLFLSAVCIIIINRPLHAVQKTCRSGPVQAVVSIDPDEIDIGDNVKLELTVTAEPGVEVLMPEFGQMLGRFTIHDFTTLESVDEQGRNVIKQQYMLQTRRSGEQYIVPLLIEFVDHRPGRKSAPDDLDAYELLTERISFNVNSVLPKDALADLHPPLDTLPQIVADTGRKRNWMITVALVLTAVTAAAGLILRLKKGKLAAKRSAFQIALKRLEQLVTQPHGQPDEIEQFFVELSSIIRQYLEQRFRLRAPELTTEEFLVLISRSPDMSDEHQVLLRDFLHRADLVKFARFTPSENDIHLSIEAARKFLHETRPDEDKNTEPDTAHERRQRPAVTSAA